MTAYCTYSPKNCVASIITGFKILNGTKLPKLTQNTKTRPFIFFTLVRLWGRNRRWSLAKFARTLTHLLSLRWNSDSRGRRIRDVLVRYRTDRDENRRSTRGLCRRAEVPCSRSRLEIVALRLPVLSEAIIRLDGPCWGVVSDWYCHQGRPIDRRRRRMWNCRPKGQNRWSISSQNVYWSATYRHSMCAIMTQQRRPFWSWGQSGRTGTIIRFVLGIAGLVAPRQDFPFTYRTYATTFQEPWIDTFAVVCWNKVRVEACPQEPNPKSKNDIPWPQGSIRSLSLSSKSSKQIGHVSGSSPKRDKHDRYEYPLAIMKIKSYLWQTS